MHVKITALFFTLGLCSLTLGGCGKNGTQAESSAPVSTQSSAASTTAAKVTPAGVSKGGTQEISLGKGNFAGWDLIRAEAKAPLAFTTEQEFQTRLKSGGTIVVDGSDIVVGEPDFSSSKTVFLALDTLEFKNGGGFVTGGNNLVIFANKITAADGRIRAFTEKTKKAADGQGDGAAGTNGDSGGNVTIFAVNGIEGRLHADVSGQDGGNGTKGTVGRQGRAGVKGSQGVSDLGVNCRQGGGDGSPGEAGVKGNAGGSGGVGGHGGFLQVYNIGPEPIPSASIEFVANPGTPGSGGAGGDGGPGGPGGEGGNGAGACHGGNTGPQGPQGPTGDPGTTSKPSAKGDVLIKNVNLEFTIKTSQTFSGGK